VLLAFACAVVIGRGIRIADVLAERPLTALESVGEAGAVVASAALVAGVLAVLAFVSRDRRPVLSCLAGYAAASVGLSALSAVAVGQWAVTATHLEASGEALAASPSSSSSASHRAGCSAATTTPPRPRPRAAGRHFPRLTRPVAQRPVPRRMEPTVRSRIFRSSQSDQFSM
jgi:hypothetical protein